MKPRTRFRCALALLLTLARPSLAATPAEYNQALSHVQAALAAQIPMLHAGEAPTVTPPQFVADRVLAPIKSLEVGSAAPRPVNTLLLRQAIRAAGAIRDYKKRARAYSALNSQIILLRREMAVTPPADSSASAATEAARKILRGPDFAALPVAPPGLAEQIAAWLDRHMRFSGPTPRIDPNIIKGILIVILSLAFAVIVYVIVMHLRGRQWNRAAPLALDDTEAALVESRDAGSLRALAEQEARRGQFRQAIRLIYLAALVTLDTEGVLRFDRSKTNWEYLRALRAAGLENVSRSLTPMTREFDRIWYGSAPAEAADWARALSQFEAMQGPGPLPVASSQGGSR